MTRPDIFGIDLAGIVDDAFQAANGSFPCTLIKQRAGPRDPMQPTAGRAIVPVNIGCRGFLDVRKRKAGEDAVERTKGVFVIFGASLPANEEPMTGDTIVSPEEGKTFTIQADGVERDPAGATYECEVMP
jgi:hypothetical protein